ncbi:MAG TPA: hypothetical protein VF518_04425 [Polyangia bacterium]
MRREHLSTTMLVAGILGFALGGCDNSTTGAAGSGGTTSGSGGAAAGGSGGTSAAGGSASGGTTGSGGTTVQTGTGGRTGSGGSAPATGGTAGGTGGRVGGTGGRTTGTSTEATGGTVASGGVAGGTTGATGGAVTGGTMGTGGRGGTSGGGVIATGGASGTGGKISTSSSTSTGTCTASKDAGKTVSGSGPHKVTIESNSDAGIKCGTIYRPTDLGGADKYPIFVWGEGGCSQSGTSNQAAMGEIASHGYFIVADGVVSGTACTGGQDGKAMLDYITWAIAENGKSCSAYYQSLDTTKIAADGFSCGGLMAENVSGDARFTTIGITSSGLFSADQALYKKIHTPFKILLGGSADMAYTNGERDYDQISALGIPILLLSKDGAGHGGDLGSAKGNFNTVNLAWLNWQLKGDETATGKGLLWGSSCKYCTASGWEYKSKNIP